MSMFRQAAQRLAAAIDDTMGECVRIVPVINKPNQPGTPLPAQAFDASAVFTHKSELAFQNTQTTRALSGDGGIEGGPLIQTRRPIFSFTTSQLVLPIRRGYRITRCDGSIWEVTAVKPDGVSRTEVEVVQLGRGRDVL